MSSSSSNTTRRPKLGISGSFMGLTGKIVTVLVGTAGTPFCIHWGLLTSKSTFFNAALTGSWQESTEGTIRLVEEDPELFSTYVLWIYNQDWTVDETNGGNGKPLSSDAHCKLYILADRFGSESLQNAIVDRLRERAATRSRFEMRVKTFGFVYENTVEGAPLRRLLVDFLVWKLSLKNYGELVEVAPRCLYDALKVYGKRCSYLEIEPPYRDSVACGNYHVHQDGTVCTAAVALEAKSGKSK